MYPVLQYGTLAAAAAAILLPDAVCKSVRGISMLLARRSARGPVAYLGKFEEN